LNNDNLNSSGESRNNESKPKPAERRKARHYAMQALYQWHMAGAALNEIEAEFRADYDMSKVDVPYFQGILHGVPKMISEIEDIITPLLDRKLSEIDPVELSLLRMGVYEMVKRVDVPYKVVINETVSLAKKFGDEESHKYINGVLDVVARNLRSVEVKAAGK